MVWRNTVPSALLRSGRPAGVALRLAIIAIVTLLGGCASSSAPDGGLRNDHCSAQWRSIQGELRAQGIRDAQAVPVPAAPYLRVTRQLGDFNLDELTPEQRLEWLERALSEGMAGLSSEVSRLASAPELTGLQGCARREIELMAYDDRRWKQMAETVAVPDAYRQWRRYVGLFPLFRPFMQMQVNRLEAHLESQYGDYEAEGQWQRYRPAPPQEESVDVAAIIDRAGERSSLGLYWFTDQERQQLLAYHAPVLEVETQGSHDQPGSPQWRNDRWEISPPVRVYTQISAMRWRNGWVPQLVYHFWFDERPRDTFPGLYGGRLDGLIWRVTLDRDGDVLMYDSVHPCGCYLKWHPVEARLELRPERPDDGIMTLMPVSRPPADARPLVRLQSGTHYVVDILYSEADGKEGEGYGMAPYNELRSITDHGITRSLFGPEGIVPGTQRLERFLLWNTGAVSPGAMRQWGHHATSFIGTRHFDSPDLLQRYFAPRAP